MLMGEGVEYSHEKTKTSALPVQQLRHNNVINAIVNVDNHNAATMIISLRMIFLFTIVASLIKIYPHHITDELFIFKMVTLVLSLTGLCITRMYKDHYNELPEN